VELAVLLRGARGGDGDGQERTDCAQDCGDAQFDGDSGVVFASGGGAARDLGMVVRGMWWLALSASGETEEILAVAGDDQAGCGVPLIAMTGDEMVEIPTPSTS